MGLGDNSEAQLGDGTRTPRSRPYPLTLTGVTAIAAGFRHSLPGPNGLTALVAEAHAAGDLPAVAMTVDCLATGPLGESIAVRHNSLGPVVAGSSAAVLTSGTYQVCSYAVAQWPDPANPLVTRSETEERHCAPG